MKEPLHNHNRNSPTVWQRSLRSVTVCQAEAGPLGISRWPAGTEDRESRAYDASCLYCRRDFIIGPSQSRLVSSEVSARYRVLAACRTCLALSTAAFIIAVAIDGFSPADKQHAQVQRTSVKSAYDYGRFKPLGGACRLRKVRGCQL